MTKTFNKDSIISIEGGYVVVDKEDDIIKENGEVKAVYFDATGKADEICLTIRQHNLQCKAVFPNVTFYEGHKRFAKIIASIGIKIEGVPLIEILDEAGQLAVKEYPHSCKDTQCQSCSTERQLKRAFIRGYEANTKQYSEEDMIKMFAAGRSFEVYQLAKNLDSFKETTNPPKNDVDFLISLHKRIPISVELEYNTVCALERGKCDCSEQNIDCQCTKLELKINPETNAIIPIKINY